MKNGNSSTLIQRGFVSALPTIIALVVCCLSMSAVECFISPPYAVKSLIKVSLFVLIPIGVLLLTRDRSILSVFKFRIKDFLAFVGLGIGLFAFILGAYFLFGRFFDLSGIADSLNDVGINAENFIFISVYISLCNSFLEEFLFRGFAFLGLSEKIGVKWACAISALCFALYHVTMMIGWYSVPLTLLVIFALFVGGVMLNLLDLRSRTVYPSWLVHIFANLAINTIGMILLGII